MTKEQIQQELQKRPDLIDFIKLFRELKPEDKYIIESILGMHGADEQEKYAAQMEAELQIQEA